MRFRLETSPHVPPATHVPVMMRRVLYALAPGAAALVWIFGWGPAVNVALAAGLALACEAAMLAARGRPLRPFLADGSALVTAALLGLSLPPLAPWWLTLLGVVFAVVVAKHLYGGLGYNPFNPAMVGYVVLLISFPREMIQWLPPAGPGEHAVGPLESVAAIFTGELPGAMTLDGLSAATPLDTVKTELGRNRTLSEIHAAGAIVGALGARGWEWVNAAFLGGGLALIALRVIRWQIPVAMLGGLFVIAFMFYLSDPDTYPSPLFHLFSGATMLGAFFIATDPVSAATTDRGRLIFGAGIGVLVYVIRTWGGYPDGVAFAVLLMNMAAPTIDRYTQPRVFGTGGERE